MHQFVDQIAVAIFPVASATAAAPAFLGVPLLFATRHFNSLLSRATRRFVHTLSL
jgi:hypothetical protein